MVAKESRIAKAASESVAFLLRMLIAGGGVLGLGFGAWKLFEKLGCTSEDFKNILLGAGTLGIGALLSRSE